MRRLPAAAVTVSGRDARPASEAEQGGPDVLAPGQTFMIQRMGAEEGPFTLADLQAQVQAKYIRSASMVRRADVAGAGFPASEIPGLYSDKDFLTTLLISFLLGWFGIDRFYLGYTGLGVLKLITFGFCGIWYVIDLILIVLDNLPDANGLPLRH